MRRWYRPNARTISFAIVLALGVTNCKRKPTSTSSGTDAPLPADRLMPGEIAEGRERAFNLPLPARSRIQSTFPTSVHVGSEHTDDELVRFVRARVTGGTVTTRGGETIFERVQVGHDASKTLTIHILPVQMFGDFQSQMIVDELPKIVDPPGTTDEERWKRVGLSPDGKLLDRDRRE